MKFPNSSVLERRSFEILTLLDEAEEGSNPQEIVDVLIDWLGPDALRKLLNEKRFPTGLILRVWRRAGRAPDLGELSNKIYHFEIWPAGRKYKTKTINLRGDQKLRDFDSEIREAFDLDTFDHLSEFFLAVGWGWDFWGLGPIYPDGTGKGAEIIVGDMRLSGGDRFSYVYDFGDMYRFILTLKKIDI